MKPTWAGHFFTLWRDRDQDRDQSTCYRIGGPEAGGLTKGFGGTGAPAADDLYWAVFDSFWQLLTCDLLVSVLDREEARTIAGLVSPSELVVLPLEWSDHYFEVLTIEEAERELERDANTVCFTRPQERLRESLEYLWTELSELAFPLLALHPETRWVLSRWAPMGQFSDARDFLLSQYKGLLYISCPRELYVVGDESILQAAIRALKAVELEHLAGGSWLAWAKEHIVCSTYGSYYLLGDPRIEQVEIFGTLRDITI